MSAPPKSAEAFPTLTVNSRLARWLLLEHNETQKALGLKVWPTPEILPRTAWLRQVWVQSWPDKYILTERQSQQLWADIVQRDPQQNIKDLLHLKETAKRVAGAHTLVQEYRLPAIGESAFATEESKAFQKWRAIYENRLRQLGALDPAAVMDEVFKAMSQGRIAIPKGLVFGGFEEITPQFRDWLRFLENNQTSIHFHPEIPGREPPSLKSLASGKYIEVRDLADQKQEAVECARWVRAHYQPGIKIGVVVIDLKSCRSLLKRALSQELAPASVYPWRDKDLPFNMSLGPTLWEEPMIHIAAQILSIQESEIPLQTFTSVIRSPYLNVGQAPSSEVHSLEQKLLRRKTLTVYLSEVIKWLDESNSTPVSKLLVRWKEHVTEKQNRLPSQWAKTFSEFFKDLGWPGAGRTLTSREYQVYESWKDCLDEFAALDPVLKSISRSRAVETLRTMVREHPFQEKTREQPIQVVGLLESSGMRFDHLWIMGCHADVLPALPSPNPFLPVEFRKNHPLPHATAQRELDFAENSLRRLLAASDNIVFSCPVRHKNVELKRSPLITSLKPDIPEARAEPGELASHCLKDHFPEAPALETIEETSVLSLSQSETILFKNTGADGGYVLLKDQAQCPFRAFARHRLFAVQEDFPELDFEHQERGTLVHRALEIFWQQTRTQAALLSLSQENHLEHAIGDSVQQALRKHEGKFSRQSLFYKLELNRVHGLIMEWLHEEMKRSPFIVHALEKKIEFQVSGLKFRLRMDRIDHTEDGKVLLMDYKTGALSFSDWFGERIQEPQLPLYAVQTSPDAVAFGQVKKGTANLKGIFDVSFSDPGLFGINLKKFSQSATWQEQLDSWRTRLTAMVGEFLAGQTRVDPIKGAATCRNCDLHTLCRIGEKTQASVEMEDGP